MSALLAQAQQVQQQLMEAQEALANSEVHGQAGGGLVQVTMKGSGEVVAVAIDPKVVDPSDVETLQDLIVGAIAELERNLIIERVRQACAAPGWKAGISAGGHSISIGLLFSRSALGARA